MEAKPVAEIGDLQRPGQSLVIGPTARDTHKPSDALLNPCFQDSSLLRALLVDLKQSPCEPRSAHNVFDRGPGTFLEALHQVGEIFLLMQLLLVEWGNRFISRPATLFCTRTGLWTTRLGITEQASQISAAVVVTNTGRQQGARSRSAIIRHRCDPLLFLACGNSLHLADGPMESCWHKAQPCRKSRQ